MKTKFTPGEWEARDLNTNKPFISGTTETGATSFVAFVDVDYKNNQEIEANAKLIAAAPTMLEALMQLKDYDFDNAMLPEGLRILMYDAIVKATIQPNNNMQKTEKELWDLIEKANWASDHDYKRIQNKWKSLDPDTKKELEDFTNDKVSSLNKKYGKYWLGNPGIAVSDDGWMDLRAEVVGRGKEFYENITVEKLQKMALDYDYTECFTYSLHD